LHLVGLTRHFISEQLWQIKHHNLTLQH